MCPRGIINALSTFVWVADRLARRPRANVPPARRICLYYHDVTRATEGGFARQMDALLRYATPFSAATCTTARRLPPNGVAVTFDDAYAETLTRVAPILQSRGIPCLVFVPSACLGKPPAWIADTATRARCGPVASAAALRELPPDTFTFGSHSATHPYFPQLDATAARIELIASRAALEDALQRPIRDFSFPHGRYTARDLILAREAGYERVFTIHPGLALPAPDSFLVRRVRMDPTAGPWAFRLAITAAYRWRPGWRRPLPATTSRQAG